MWCEACCCCCSVTQSCLTLVTPWIGARQAFLSLTISWSLFKFMFIALVMPSSHLILWHPLLLSTMFPSIRDFSSESSVCIRWPKYWSFSFSPSSEYSGLISLKIDLVWSPCYPRDFQKSSAAPQFEGISSLAFCLLYSYKREPKQAGETSTTSDMQMIPL